MILASHNSWTFLPVRLCWMRPVAFTARCQRLDIQQQYLAGVRLFDLRIKFLNDGTPILAHGIVQYKYTPSQLFADLSFLNEKKDVYIRLTHEVRTKNEYTAESIARFGEFCDFVIRQYPAIRFHSFRNLYNYQRDYILAGALEPTCEERYSSVRPPRILDDWFPWLYARLNNRRLLARGTTSQYLMIDFIGLYK